VTFPMGNSPCSQTGMWPVEPEFDVMSIIHIDSILCGAHLMGFACKSHIPREVTCHNSLDAFASFFVNKYINHQAHEIAF